jgi:pleiotropic regulator 1
MLHKTTRTVKPTYHAPWKLVRVISGHLGWVRSVAVEPGNKWFATGAGDRVIKIWNLASGELRLSLTGHISTVRGLAVSPRHPYLFSCGEDKVRLFRASVGRLDPNAPGLDGKMLGSRS